MATDKISSDVAATMSDNASTPAPCRNELLCFLQQKSKIIPFDHLVKICMDFYRKDEIAAARCMIEQAVTKRVVKRQGAEAVKVTVEDILKIILDPGNTLPTYFAVDLGRLPPVDADHCDVSAILRELQALRSEVRVLGHLKEDVECLKVEVQQLRQAQSKVAQSVDENWPTLPRINNSPDAGPVHAVVNNSPGPSFATHAKNLKESGAAMSSRKPRKPPVIGKSSKFHNVSAVITKRSVDIFVSRWNPHTTVSEVTECVGEILQGNYADSTCCERLKSRFEHLYASFYVSVTVPCSNMKSVIDVLMNEESWPAGLLVKRYFRVKDGSK